MWEQSRELYFMFTHRQKDTFFLSTFIFILDSHEYRPYYVSLKNHD